MPPNAVSDAKISGGGPPDPPMWGGIPPSCTLPPTHCFAARWSRFPGFSWISFLIFLLSLLQTWHLCFPIRSVASASLVVAPLFISIVRMGHLRGPVASAWIRLITITNVAFTLNWLSAKHFFCLSFHFTTACSECWIDHLGKYEKRGLLAWH